MASETTRLNGIVSMRSKHTVKDTIDRLVSIVESKGMTVFCRIDHRANAIPAGLDLRPTEVILFGNPKAGTILMQDNQQIAIDLPVKALAYENESGDVFLMFIESRWLAGRYGLSSGSDRTVKAIDDGLALVCTQAAGG